MAFVDIKPPNSVVKTLNDFKNLITECMCHAAMLVVKKSELEISEKYLFPLFIVINFSYSVHNNNLCRLGVL